MQPFLWLDLRFITYVRTMYVFFWSYGDEPPRSLISGDGGGVDGLGEDWVKPFAKGAYM